VASDPGQVAGWLMGAEALPDLPLAFAEFDWRLHHNLTVASGNPVFTLILNGFSGFYEDMACRYFASTEARQASRAFYADLRLAAQQADADRAEQLTRLVMQESIKIWKRSAEGGA
jgi:GntR family negative regulator for fad regulon and positive regulator of fabA